MVTILLAGGQSTRFWPLKEKNLTRFFGKPLLVWHFEQLQRLHVRDVIVVVNSSQLEEVKRVPAPKRISVTYVTQEGKGQGKAVLAAGSVVKVGPALILNASDIYEDELLKIILSEYKRDGSKMLMGAVRVGSYFPGGYLKLKASGTVEKIIEKPAPGKEPSDIVRLLVDLVPNMAKLHPMLAAYSKFSQDGYERALNKYLGEGTLCKPIITSHQWLYLKYPWHILNVMDTCLDTIAGQTIARNVRIGKNVTLEGPLVLEEGVRILEGAKIVGPTYIGKGTIVGNNTMIRKSHIGDFCVIGFSTDITRSYIGNSCWLHTNFIGDSVIGEAVSIGAGTVLANLRLDESTIFSQVEGEKVNTERTKLGAIIGDNVRVGVHVSIMPGIKIGSNSFIGAGVILGEDIGEGMYCRITPTVTISQNNAAAAAYPNREQFRKAL